MEKVTKDSMSRLSGRSGELSLAQRKTLFIAVLAYMEYHEEEQSQDDTSESEMKTQNAEFYRYSKALKPLKTGSSEVIEMFKRMKKEGILVQSEEDDDQRDRDRFYMLNDMFRENCEGV